MSEIKEPGHISSKLLNTLGGEKETFLLGEEEVSLVHDGSYLWGIGDKEKGAGILNHVLLTRRTALALAKDLKERRAPGFENINLQYVADAATLHDLIKLYSEDRERLTPEQKSALGLPQNFKEISNSADEVGVEWLQSERLPPEIYRAVLHDFPLHIVDDPYWKIVLIADYMSGQRIMSVVERLQDVRARWIDEKIEKGEIPRIEPDRFDTAKINIEAVAGELFGYLETTDSQFIESHNLNSPDSMDRGEIFIRKTAERGTEDKAKRAVGVVERIAASGNYGKISYSEWRKNKNKANQAPEEQ